MTFLLRCLVLALASFGVAVLVSSLVVALIWIRKPWIRQSWSRRAADGREAPALPPAHRAGLLLRLRLVPVAVAAGAAFFAVVGLWRFESREADESVGWALRVGAGFGALYLTIFAARAWQMARETRHLLHAWLSGAVRITLPGVTVPAYRIQTEFPVVAVVGIFRPTLVVDATVLDACSGEELAAILAHEQGHLRRWDNLRRALFSATPDLLSATPISRDLRDAWREATEEAADDVAAERGEDVRIHLAAALVRVARLAPATSNFHGAQLPASALYRGESVERRVRRLCGTPAPAARRSARWGVSFSTFAVVVAFAFQQRIHDAMELIVAALP